MKTKLLRCKKSKVWIPDDYLTNIVGFCDRGRFVITRTFTLPCVLMNDGNLYIEGFDKEIIDNDEFDVNAIRCGNCGGEIEVVEVDPDEILNNLRSRELNMKKARKKRQEDDAQAKKDESKESDDT